jgi:hypothetical protein
MFVSPSNGIVTIYYKLIPNRYLGSTSRRHRLPKLYAIALSHIHDFFKS